VDKRKRKAYYSGKKKRYMHRYRLWLTIMGLSFTKQIIRKEEDMIMAFIKRISS
jgi:hypothetical protein